MPTPSVKNVLRYADTPNVLDNAGLKYPAAAYSLRKLKSSATKAIRVRDDTNTETDIGFCGNNLCTGSLTSWLNRNQLASYPLGVDSDANGISDGWSKFTDAGITATWNIDQFAQKIEITASSSANWVGVGRSMPILVSGNSLSQFVTYKATGNIEVWIQLIWYNGSTYLSENNVKITTPSNDWTLISQINKLAPATSTNCYVRLRIQPKVTGDTGTVWFKDASVIISNQSAYVTTWYDQSGSGNHATQTTAGNQPRIVNAGIIDRDFDATKANAIWPTFASASGNTIVSNGNFTSTTGWEGDGANISASNNILTITGTGAFDRTDANQITSISSVVGRKYFIRAKLKVTNPSCSSISIRGIGSTGTNSSEVALQTSPVNGTQYTLSGIYTVISAHTGNVKVIVRATYADASTANGKVMEVQEVVVIDVSDMGMPTMYFDGSNDYLSVPYNASLNPTGSISLNAIISKSNWASASDSRILSNTEAGGYQLGLNSSSYASKIGCLIRRNNDYTNLSYNLSSITSNQNIFTVIYNGRVGTLNLNGTNISTSDAGSVYPIQYANNMPLGIGAEPDKLDSSFVYSKYIDANMSEIILFGATLTESQRKRLENNQGKYYSIPVV